MMNVAVLVGRLTKDPELRRTNSDKAVASFILAVNRPFKNKDGDNEADFIRIVVWGKQAENVEKYITKGSQVAVDGRIQTHSYDDNDGKRVFVTEVVADNVTFLDTKKSDSKDESHSPYDYDKGDDDKSADDIDIAQDDLPF